MTQHRLPTPSPDPPKSPLSTGGKGGVGRGPATKSYRYLAYSSTQTIVNSTIKALSVAEAEAILTKAGYRPLAIRPIAQSLSLGKLFRPKRIKPQDLLTMTEQLALLLRASVPIATTLESLRGQFRNPEFNEALATITEDVRGGIPLSQAMDKYPNIFSNLYVQMIRLGEGSGDLEAMLDNIRTYFGRELAVRKKIQRAMSYPMIVIGLAAVVAIIMVTFVLPRVVIMFEALNVPLPLLTRIVLGASGVIMRNQLGLAVVVLLLGSAGYLATRRPGSKRRLHQAILRVPLLKNIVVYRELGQFSRLTSLMLHNGLPLPTTLGMIAGISGNLEIKAAFQDAQAEVTSGRPLSASLERAWFIPPMFMQMVRTGEISGNLEDNLTSMANFYDRELDSLIETALGMLEPLLTIAIGLVVAGVALSVIAPIYSIIGKAGGG